MNDNWEGSDLVIDLVDSGSVVEFVDAVVDLDELGDVIGVEILGLIARHPHLPSSIEQLTLDGSKIRVSCDPDADALYIRFNTSRSLDQVVRAAVVVFGPNDTLIKVAIHME